jgi:hypothetical protein
MVAIKWKEKIMSKSTSKKTKRASHDGSSLLSGRFWTQWIAPKGAALLSERVGPVYFVVKNHGQTNVLLVAEYGERFDVSPGTVRATYGRGTIRVENPGDKPALIEFEFLPILIKP